MMNLLKNQTFQIWGIALIALCINSMIFFLVREQMNPGPSVTLTDDYLHFIEIRPFWELIAANLTSVAGFLAIPWLLMRRRLAVWLFGISAVAAGLTLLPTFILGPFIIGIIMLVATIGAALFTSFSMKAVR